MANRAIDFVEEVFSRFSDDQALTQAAGVAYYAVLSIPPLVLLFIAITSYLGQDERARMVNLVEGSAGKPAAQFMDTIIRRGQKNLPHATGSLIVSIAVLVFSASGVLSALQSGLNMIWGVKSAPGQGVWGWLRKRLLSMLMILAIAFILLVSLVISSIIDFAFARYVGAKVIAIIVPCIVYVLLFGTMYKVLPDVKISWSDVWIGALITAALFSAGKYVISMYIAHANYARSYGAAGSMIALLVWIYFASVIFYFGGEITEVVAQRRGARSSPTATR